MEQRGWRSYIRAGPRFVGILQAALNMATRDLTTPVQDERVLGNFSPVSNWGEFDTNEERIMDKLSSMEVLMRELHLSTREHVAKGLREMLSYEKALIGKVLKNQEDINTGLREIQSRHQADPLLVSGIIALVNQSVKYLQDTSPNLVSTDGQGNQAN